MLSKVVSGTITKNTRNLLRNKSEKSYLKRDDSLQISKTKVEWSIRLESSSHPSYTRQGGQATKNKPAITEKKYSW